MVAWYLILCIFISTTVGEKTLRAQDITALQKISSHFDFNWNLEDISLCQISELSCREMSEGLVLYAIHLAYGHTTSIPKGLLRGLNTVVSLEINAPYLNTVEVDAFQGLLKLDVLRIVSDGLSELDEGVFDGISVRTLILETRIGPSIKQNLFKGLDRLEYLNLAKNSIVQIPVGIFDPLESLNQLDLSGNEISTWPTKVLDIPTLEILDISSNRIVDLPNNAFSGLPNLYTLSLNNNQLVFLRFNAFDHIDNIVNLDLSKNNMKILTSGIFAGMKKISKLYLSNNNLEKLPPNIFESSTSLTELDLRGNLLDNLDLNVFKPLSNLKKLDLGYNRLKSLPFNFTLPKLENLWLTGNLFSTVPSGIHKDLKLLDFNDNCISTCDAFEAHPLIRNCNDILDNPIHRLSCSGSCYNDNEYSISTRCQAIIYPETYFNCDKTMCIFNGKRTDEGHSIYDLTTQGHPLYVVKNLFIVDDLIVKTDMSMENGNIFLQGKNDHLSVSIGKVLIFDIQIDTIPTLCQLHRNESTDSYTLIVDTEGTFADNSYQMNVSITIPGITTIKLPIHYAEKSYHALIHSDADIALNNTTLTLSHQTYRVNNSDTSFRNIFFDIQNDPLETPIIVEHGTVHIEKSILVYKIPTLSYYQRIVDGDTIVLIEGLRDSKLKVHFDVFHFEQTVVDLCKDIQAELVYEKDRVLASFKVKNTCAPEDPVKGRSFPVYGIIFIIIGVILVVALSIFIIVKIKNKKKARKKDSSLLNNPQ